ncbi:MAG: hypothetical protein RL585_1082, partial [Pseudomonadota bacterium]
AQKSAEDDLKKAGLKVVAPADGDIANMRKNLMQGQAELVEKMKMDKDVVEQVMKALRDAGVGY